MLFPQVFPKAIIKIDHLRCQELLQRPASSEPFALFQVFDSLDVVQVRIANGRVLVVSEH